jgi:ABC-2 type transport system ATP-binding protein
MEQVEEICDHIVLVNKGKKILDGTVNQVKQDFKEHLYSIGAASVPTDADAPYEWVGSEDHRLVVRIREGKRANDVLRYLIDRNIEVESFSEILPSLNDIFIRLVEGTPTARQFQKD